MKQIITAGLLMAFVCVMPALSQEMGPEEQIAAWNSYLDSLEWNGEGQVGAIGNQAEIIVPRGYVFTGREGTRDLMETFGNLLTEQELGFIAPIRTAEQVDFPWFAVFEFEDTGYVSDEDKADLDASEMMNSMVESQAYANEQRAEMGYMSLDITGWVMEPRYNDATNNLEWAINLRSGDGGENVNLNTRLLGRDGVMKVTLVCDPADLQSTIPQYQRMLDDFAFQDGRRYAQYSKGDKIAKYGLAGLVVGGGAAVLAKTGLLQRLFKPILVGIVAIGAWLRKKFSGRG